MVVTEGEGARPGETVQVPAAVRALDGQAPGPDGDDRQGTGIGPRGRLPQGLPAQHPFLRGRRCDGHGLGHGQGGRSSRGANGVSGPRAGMPTTPVRTNDADRSG
ncbi:putative class III aminotransferase [Streptomyces sp. Tu6071]|nr:putative class III aminotransferase [Streptomyces sp. Tu6071]